jgi:Fe-S cluster biogenesis protein NfuA
MFIQTQATSDPATMRFLPGQPVLPSGTANFADRESSVGSPLAQRLFEIDGITGVFLDPEAIVIKKEGDRDWHLLKPVILGAIMEHFTAGAPVILDDAGGDDIPGDLDEESEITAQIKELVETRIRPSAVQEGGDVIYKGYKDGTVYLEMSGAGFSLQTGIENMLRHYVPEVTGVRDFRDAIPKPGLETPDGIAVRQVLDERINPSIASHGGRISLVDVKDDTVYLRLEGGCQGCGMANVTLKQGVEVEIKRMVPSITSVLDVTDHAGGSNPYYQPGKGG